MTAALVWNYHYIMKTLEIVKTFIQKEINKEEMYNNLLEEVTFEFSDNSIEIRFSRNHKEYYGTVIITEREYKFNPYDRVMDLVSMCHHPLIKRIVPIVVLNDILPALYQIK